MANVKICDICDRNCEITFKIKAKRAKVLNQGVYSLLKKQYICKWETIDLCDDCYSKLILTKDKTALDKQIPKNPHISESGMFYICPCCDKFIDRNERAHGNIDIPYCKWCGQALDWSKDNEA